MMCPCCSEKEFKNCCSPFLSGEQLPATPEQLMRSRYTAYVQCDVEYLLKTTHPKTRKYYSAKSIREWAQQCEWLKLEVKEAIDNSVVFYAYFSEHGQLNIHKERSTFREENGVWYFVDGVAAE